MTADTKMQDLLSVLTDAILADELNVEVIVERYDVPRKEANVLLHLIRRLRGAFVVVQPAPAFSRRLKQELLGEPEQNILWRWRRLPARVQLAAAFALLGGFGLLLVRGLTLQDWRQRKSEEAAASARS